MGKINKKGFYIWKQQIKTLVWNQKTKIFFEKLLSAILINDNLIIQGEVTLKEKINKLKKIVKMKLYQMTTEILNKKLIK
jgi:hypothetical protein